MVVAAAAVTTTCGSSQCVVSVNASTVDKLWGAVGAGGYLVRSELPFLAEARCQVLGLGLLLGQVVLVVKMLVLNLTDKRPIRIGLEGREK